MNWGESVSTRGGALQAFWVWLLCDFIVKQDMSNPLNKLYEAYSFDGGGGSILHCQVVIIIINFKLFIFLTLSIRAVIEL